MNTPNKKETTGLSLVEAVETLSNIADLEIDQNMGIAQKHDLSLYNTPLTYHTVHWLHQKDAGETINMIKTTFRVILNYLQEFYTHEYAYIEDVHVIERIKTIMMLVGEAARKLDKYTTLFHKAHAKSVTELKEYKKLQEFYQTRISKKIDEGTLGKWILAISQKSRPKESSSLRKKKEFFTQHLFIDLESVKKDVEYELFYLKKEDGTRFFSPRLVRNLKLVSDFGEYFIEKKADPFEIIPIWRDKIAHLSAREIVRASKTSIERFYFLSSQTKEDELAGKTRKILMALLLAANKLHLTPQLPLKNCFSYFYDFLFYLQEMMHSKAYKHLITYPPKKSERLLCSILQLAHFLCSALYTHLSPEQEMAASIHDLIQQNTRSTPQTILDKHRALSVDLSHAYTTLSKQLKHHPNGPIHLILQALEEGKYHEFEPLMQQNLPGSLFSLYIQDSIYRIVRWPSPTTQEFIDKAAVSEIFKGFLRSYSTDALINKCLIINYQDRFSWKEQMRSIAIEDLPDHETFARQTAILTIPKDTEFYTQASGYSDYFDATLFIEELKQHISQYEGGYVLPQMIDTASIHAFIKCTVENIHRVFFENKNTLSKNERLDFIEIFYVFLELKVIETIKPDYIGLVCKDGVDVSTTAAALLFVFIKFISQERLSEMDREYLDSILYTPGLLFRERMLMQERFHRFISALKTIESTREAYGSSNFVKIIYDLFGPLYTTPILHSKAIVQRNRDFF